MGYEGLIGYEGLYIVDTTAFPRPVQIVRQFISHSETLKNQGSRRYP
jgi:hypothetical protein